MEKKHKIILVEDDPSLGYLLSEYLGMKGFTITWAKHGKEALVKMETQTYDLAILDIMMPQMDGFTLAAAMRDSFPELPFLFLSAKSLKIDVLKGFALGAVDYLKKPIDDEELVIRIESLLSRIAPSNLDSQKKVQQLGRYTFNSLNHELTNNGNMIHLTTKENELLLYLASRQNQLCSHKEILLKLWGRNDFFNKKSLNVFITRLRKYLVQDASLKIENVHGQGFILRTE